MPCRFSYPNALRAGAILLAFLASAGTAAAQDTGQSNVEIHGFGGWAYGETDGLAYAVGDGDGRYDNAEFALNVSARPTDRLSIVAQVFLESQGFGDDGQEEAELDYAFAEWFVSDALKLRAGRVKHPFGLYGEIFDVGTLRPFYLLPQSIYGPNGFTAKAYNGVGVTGNRSFGSGWGVQYDLYGGEIEGEFDIPGILSSSADPLAPQISLGFRVEDTIGLRLNLATPVDGLTVGLSAYRGDEEVGITVARRETLLFHGEYLTDRWSVRSEWGTVENVGNFEEDGGYLEVAYKLTDRWELAARGEDWQADLPGLDPRATPPFVLQILEHEELALGVSYWFTPSLVVRLNVHQTEGNRFAYPDSRDEIQDALVTGRLEDQTELVVLGTQFSF